MGVEDLKPTSTPDIKNWIIEDLEKLNRKELTKVYKYVREIIISGVKSIH